MLLCTFKPFHTCIKHYKHEIENCPIWLHTDFGCKKSLTDVTAVGTGVIHPLRAVGTVGKGLPGISEGSRCTLHHSLRSLQVITQHFIKISTETCTNTQMAHHWPSWWIHFLIQMFFLAFKDRGLTTSLALEALVHSDVHLHKRHQLYLHLQPKGGLKHDVKRWWHEHCEVSWRKESKSLKNISYISSTQGLKHRNKIKSFFFLTCHVRKWNFCIVLYRPISFNNQRLKKKAHHHSFISHKLHFCLNEPFSIQLKGPVCYKSQIYKSFVLL